ncbi:MAG: DciA family protein [Chloroflexota bacterium]
MSPRRPMRRVGDLLPGMAVELGIQDELRLARQLTAWERIIAEHVPAAVGGSNLLSLQPPTLVVSAASPQIAQELRLRHGQLLAAFAQAPEGVRLLELRVVVRPPTVSSGRDRP